MAADSPPFLSSDAGYLPLDPICPGIHLSPLRRLSDDRIIRVVSAFFRREQHGNVTHDLVTDLVELPALTLSMPFGSERAERFADVDLDAGASSALEAGKNLVFITNRSRL
jgi:hypothetical protein